MKVGYGLVEFCRPAAVMLNSNQTRLIEHRYRKTAPAMELPLLRAKASAFIATSLDGFLARVDGSIDWLIEANAAVPEGEECGYREFMASVDCIVMGRKTFEQALTFGAWPYEDKRLVVLSHRPLSLSVGLPNTVTLSSDSPEQLVERLAAEGFRHLYVDGGITIQRFLKAGVIDDVTITLIPLLLGQGIPLFGPLESDLQLIHTETRVYGFGFVQLRYRVANHE